MGWDIRLPGRREVPGDFTKDELGVEGECGTREGSTTGKT